MLILTALGRFVGNYENDPTGLKKKSLSQFDFKLHALNITINPIQAVFFFKFWT